LVKESRAMNLGGKVALVTGAGRGIGFRIGCRLHEEGASVVFNDRAVSEMVVQYIESNSTRSKAIFHQADIAQPKQIEQMVERTMREFGRFDILINNAGIDPTAPFLQVSEDMWNQVIDTNLKGTFFCAQKAANKMCEVGRGRIVNISSVHSLATMPGFSAYSASKGAINALTRELALELAPHGITVNAVAPGAIEVERFVNNPLYDRDALAEEIPSGRVGKPEDISGIVAFLCSDDAAWMTGQVIAVDGGTLTRLFLYAGRPIPSGSGQDR
jgi:NAD(P)-dependent dehydrogenase (short-subunit alcohol dehydrogenase family)